MKKISTGMIALIVIVGILVIGGIWVFSSYNGLAAAREGVSTGQAAIDTQLQRRADLIPNLVNTVKGFAQQEKDIINSVTEARAKLAGAQTMPDKAEANTELTGALSRLMVVVENYPELKSNETYVALMDELAGTENRVAVARDDYNNLVRSYNTRIVTFPTAMFAGMFGFEKAEYFQSSQGAEVAPEVNF